MSNVTVAIRGAKGGGSSHTPTETADSLQSIATARIVDLISEGEIRGPKHGFANIAKDIYYNETPVQNEDGSYNFENVIIDSRSGTQSQSYMTGFPGVESENGVGLELTDTVSWVQAITNTELSAVRIHVSVPSLQQSNPSTGDITGYSITYEIDVSTDGGSYVVMKTDAITGKASGKYERTARINLPAAQTGWSIRVRRVTPMKHLATVSDTLTMESYTEIIDVKLRYPNSAVIGQILNAQQFQTIPSRAFDMYGRIVQIPSNYDADTRAYAGAWDGTFKPGWTNNPAWIYYDLITHPRYGLGQYIKAGRVNKWTLYAIAQYCDVMVDDGKGGLEPRFTCTIYLQKQEDATKVLNDLTSIFRGMPYWADGAIQTAADMPADPDYTYGPSNVIDGNFVYAGSNRKTRYTAALVSWNDPDDFGRAKTAYVPYRDGIARYGVQETQMIAVGATSAGQAQRAGLWVLYTSCLEGETANFQVGLDGTVVAPGRICRIADPTRAGQRTSGRISASTATTVTVDAAPAVAVGDTLTAALATGVSETRVVTEVDGRVIHVSPGYSQAPLVEGMWTVESDNLNAATYRVLSVADSGTGSELAFTLSVMRHNASKFAAIDNGALIHTPPISFPPQGSIQPPANITIGSHAVIKQGIAITVMTLAWDRPANAVEYNVQWRRDDGDWVSAGFTGATSATVENVFTGAYLARVAAIDGAGNVSLWGYSNVVQVEGKTAPPPPPVLHAVSDYLQVDVSWDFPVSVNISDTAYTEILVSRSDATADGVTAGTPAYPTNKLIVGEVGPQEVVYLWGRLVDKSGNIGEWSEPVSVAGMSTDDFFKPVQDAVDQMELDVEALKQQVDAEVAQVRGDVDSALANLFPEFAGDDTIPAGSTDRYIGTWTIVDQLQEGDRSIARDIRLIGVKTDDGKAFIFDSNTAQVEPGVSLAQKLTSIQAAAVDSDARARIDEEAQARTDADGAMAEDIQTLYAGLDSANANVLLERQARTDADAATATVIQSVQAQYGSLSGQVTNEITVRASADAALSQRIDVIEAGGGLADVYARIDQESSARVAGDNANATSINSVSTKVNGNTASISTLTQSINGISARWGVMLDVNGYISGIQQLNAGGTSSFNIVADKFSLVAPGGGARTEFSAGNWRVYDAAGVLRVRLGVW